jgi:3-hydroxyisobutyrate dehydrogenase-like beta-hydroxyacid dehydrogenase
MIRRTFDPGFRIELYHKDLNLALTSARQTGVSLPNRATAQERFTPARRMAVRPESIRQQRPQLFEALGDQVIDAKQRNERAHCFCGRSLCGL